MEGDVLYRLRDVKIPNRCACCASETARHQIPTVGYAGFSMSVQYSLAFPYCDACKGHAKHEHGKRKFGGIDPNLVGLLMLGLLAGGGYLGVRLADALHIMGGAGLAIAAVGAIAGMSMMFWVPRLFEKLADARHKPDPARGCTTRSPVYFNIAGMGPQQLLAFRFGNDRFDAEFRLANTPVSELEAKLAEGSGFSGLGRR